MIKVGIIGDIGSGKSYVSKLFNCPIFNADIEVAKIYKKNRKCFNLLKKKLPKYISSFPIKKKQLGKAILNNQRNLNKINKIVHPIVRYRLNVFFKKNKKKNMVVLDIPLLLENKINNKKCILVFVDAQKKDIQKRLKKRSNYNPKIFRKLKKIQLPLEIKRKKSNYIIKNNFKSLYIKKNVKLLKNKILNNERNST